MDIVLKRVGGTNNIICANCSSGDHESEKCNSLNLKCINCGEPHQAYDRNCSHFKQEKQIVKIKIDQDVSFGMARSVVNQRKKDLKVFNYNLPKLI